MGMSMGEEGDFETPPQTPPAGQSIDIPARELNERSVEARLLSSSAS